MATTHPFNFPSMDTPGGTLYRLPTEYFLQHVLPPLSSSVDPKRVLAQVRRSGSKFRRAITKQGRWRGFAQNPAQSPRCETSSFSHFPDIVRAIAKVGARYGLQPSLQLIDRKVCWPSSDSRSSDPEHLALPQIYMVQRKVIPKEATWGDMAISGWLRKSDAVEWRIDNRENMIAGMMRCMRSVQRRFVFGFTVSNTCMEFWYYDRSQILVSNAVDWITDQLSVVRFFLPLLFADPAALGWDPTVTATGYPGQFEITVEDADGTRSVYRTLELLTSTRTELETGKGTRIWKAVELVDGTPHGSPVVLKDVWRHEELGREGDTLAAIRQCDPSQEARDLLARRTLTVLHHGDVILRSSADQHSYVDYTRLHPQNAVRFLQDKPFTDSRSMSPGAPIPPHYVTANGRRVLLGRRLHYRIVFKELCTPLYSRHSLVDVFAACGEVGEVLRIMHRNGWVHRDISYGNILLDNEEHARLVDFEYAKKVRDQEVPEFRVGTSSFMAVEVDESRRIFRPQSFVPSRWQRCRAQGVKGPIGRMVDRLKEGRALSEESLSQSSEESLPDTSDSEPPFHFNQLHDLESLWWLGTYFTFDWAEKDVPQESDSAREKDRLAKQHALAYNLFNNHTHRYDTLRTPGAFASYIRCLKCHVRRAGEALEQWRLQLVDRYMNCEKDADTILNADFDGLHDGLIATMSTIVDLIDTPQPQPAARIHDTKKRARDSDEANGNSKKPRIV